MKAVKDPVGENRIRFAWRELGPNAMTLGHILSTVVKNCGVRPGSGL